MRIAPRPKAGQEVSLDNLLNRPVTSLPNVPACAITLGSNSMILHPVMVAGEPYAIEVQYAPLERQKTNDDLIGMAITAREKAWPRPASSLEFYSILSTLNGLLQNTSTPEYPIAVQALQKILELWAQSNPLVMYSQFIYNRNPAIDDEIIHNPQIPFTKRSLGRLYGPNGPIVSPATDAAAACEMLFGNKNVVEINDVFRAVIREDLKITRISNFRLNPKGFIPLGQKGLDLKGSLYSNPDGFHAIGIKRRLSVVQEP